MRGLRRRVLACFRRKRPNQDIKAFFNQRNKTDFGLVVCSFLPFHTSLFGRLDVRIVVFSSLLIGVIFQSLFLKDETVTFILGLKLKNERKKFLKENVALRLKNTQ